MNMKKNATKKQKRRKNFDRHQLRRRYVTQKTKESVPFSIHETEHGFFCSALVLS